MNEKDCMMLQYILEEQNITKAAERLYITQPALTYRLRQIEKEFGVPVIMKSGKGIKLTQEGEYLVSYSQKVLLDLRKTKDYVVNMKNEVEGHLRIGVSSYYGLYKLPPILKCFISTYPKVQINVDTGWSSEIYELLLHEDIHVGIVKGDYQWYDQKYLINEESICIISQEEITLDSLPKIPRINFKISKQAGSYRYSSLSQTIDYWWYERFNESPLITMQVDSYETCKEMVKNGLGYAIIPSSFLNPSDELYRIDMIRKNGQAIKRNTWMLYKETSLQFTIVERFVNYIKSLK
ncbi:MULTISPECIES: LysR family transcriptional regulator [unclassified Peribacillus]|uniref:LysR family transcriptional regulator n=1 Tax=unclassified Peribacillus TaxID=2675266 RepID=UPI00178542BF|nr:LysR family transcriptional regulator [Brevibacillus sp. JNUCC-41]QOS88785.1 LysR family transcriptional regulator [Brevibacillus sp. JNUCC-41]